jgi:hypothetical protein
MTIRKLVIYFTLYRILKFNLKDLFKIYKTKEILIINYF